MAEQAQRRVQRAILSVWDKTGIVELGRGLVALGVELVSTGGTAKALREASVPVRSVEDVTGYPEMMDGRVKTLHPRIHGGLLARRDNAEDMAALDRHAIPPIDLVVVNLYPFRETVARPGATRDEIIENIDIGGPAMIRAAAKNHAHVAVVTSPDDYAVVLAELRESGAVAEGTLRRLAGAAYAHTAAYDAAVATWFAAEQAPEAMPPVIDVRATKHDELRYGENPHQRAALYRIGKGGLPDAVFHQGKTLSYNNLLDLTACYDLCRELRGGPAAVVAKHTNPCGAAVHAGGLAAAYRAARACDPVSAFGGIVALNGEVSEDLAELLSETFLEVIVAPSYSEKALARLSSKKNLRVISMPLRGAPGLGWDVRRVDGGLLVQDRDTKLADLSTCRVVTKRAPTPDELASLQFTWTVAKHVKSNAIVFGRGTVTAAVGAGQMSRVDSVRIARFKAVEPLEGTVLASDAFFPFRDGIDAAFEAGARAVAQPGGSVKDQEVIDAADEHGMAMIFTGFRHFRH